MTIPSIHGPKFSSDAYIEKTTSKSFWPRSKNDDSKPVDILCIQAMDEDHDDVKAASRKYMDGKVNYGEIKISKLEGKTPEEKMKSFEMTLQLLRQSGKIGKHTQVIFLGKPGDKEGEVNISRNQWAGTWKIEEMVRAIRTGPAAGHVASNDDFKGTIHLFGPGVEDFDRKKIKEFGNVLMHASGKYNWDRQLAVMVDRIASATTHLSAETPEEITRQMRDALQPFAGYPIYRVSNQKLIIKYATFHDDKQIEFYKRSIEKHQNPIDMLISSVERDRPETLTKRLSVGGLFTRLQESKKAGPWGYKAKERLLIALVCAKQGQAEKLAILKDQLKIKLDSPELKNSPGLRAAIAANRDRLSPEVIGFLNGNGVSTVPDNNFLEFLCKKIESDKLEDLSKFVNAFLGRKFSFSNVEWQRILLATLKTSAPDMTLNILALVGMNYKNFSGPGLSAIADEFKNDPVGTAAVMDLFENQKTTISGYLRSDEDQFLYYVLSDIHGKRDEVKADVKNLIKNPGNHGDFLKKMVTAAIDLASRRGDLSAFKFLVECGLPLDFNLGNSRTPVHYICEQPKPNAKLVEFILDEWGPTQTPPMMSHPIENLITNTQCNRQAARELTAVMIKKHPDLVNQRVEGDSRYLHYATLFLNLGVIEGILEASPTSVNVLGNNQYTPLHTAALVNVRKGNNARFSKEEEYRFKEVVSVLLKAGADLNLESQSGDTPQDLVDNLLLSNPLNLAQLQAQLVASNGVPV